MGSKTKQTTQQTKLPKYLDKAYKGVVQAGANVAKQPLKQYTGPRQAGFTPDQQTGMGMIRNSQGAALPYYNAASSMYSNVGGLPWGKTMGNTVDTSGVNAASGAVMPGVDKYDAATMEQYMDPYMQQMIDPIMERMQYEDAKQINALKGSGISMGLSPALGDRMGLAASDMAGQQALSRNQTLGQLMSQGFQNAQGQLNAQQQLQLQGGTSDQQRLMEAQQLMQQGRQEDANRILQSLSTQQTGQLGAAAGMQGLGTAAQDSLYQGIDYMMNSGQMQQAQGQQQLDQAYNDWAERNNYSKEQTDWLANLIYGSPGAAGASTTTTEPGPSLLSQLLGLGTTAIGLGKTFGSATGGRVVHRDLGGAIVGDPTYTMPRIAGPQMDVARFRPPTTDLGGVPTGPGLHLGGETYINALRPLTEKMLRARRDKVTRLPSDILKPFKRISRGAGGGGGGGGGGNPDATSVNGGRGVIRRDQWGNIISVGGKPVKRKAVGGALTGEPVPGTPEYDEALARALAGEDVGVPDVGIEEPAPTDLGGAPVSTAPGRRSRVGEFFSNMDPLVYAGLGIMGGESPFPLTNVGQGGAAGLKLAQELYSDELDQAPTIDDSGPTIRYWMAGEGWVDSGIPSYKWASATNDTTGTEKERFMEGKYGKDWRKNPTAIAEFEELLKTPQTMIDMKGSGAFATENAKGLSERMFQVIDGASNAASLTSTYGQLATLLNDPNVYTGTGGESVNALKKMGETLFGLEVEGVAAGEVASNIKNAAIGKLREEVLGPGVMSNSDRQILEGIFPGLTTSAEGIQLAYEIQKINAQAAAAKAQKLQEIMAASDGELTPQGWFKFQNWVQTNPFFTPETIREAQTRAQAAATQRGPLAGAPGLDDVKKKWGLD